MPEYDAESFLPRKERFANAKHTLTQADGLRNRDAIIPLPGQRFGVEFYCSRGVSNYFERYRDARPSGRSSMMDIAEQEWDAYHLGRMFNFNFRRLAAPAVCLCIGLLATEARGAERVRVSLGVAGPGDVKNRIISHLSGELLQRGADIVGSGFDYQIRIIAVNLESKKGRNAGYAVSVVVTAPVTEDRPSHVFKHPLVAHFLEISPPRGLPDLCKRVADGIDKEVFQIHRLTR